ATELGIELLNRAHLVEVKRQQAIAAQRYQFVVAKAIQVDAFDMATGFGCRAKVGCHWPQTKMLYSLVAQELARQTTHFSKVQVTFKDIACARDNIATVQTDLGHAAL